MIINDMSEVNIDAELIRSGDAALSRVEDKLVSRRRIGAFGRNVKAAG